MFVARRFRLIVVASACVQGCVFVTDLDGFVGVAPTSSTTDAQSEIPDAFDDPGDANAAEETTVDRNTPDTAQPVEEDASIPETSSPVMVTMGETTVLQSSDRGNGNLMVAQEAPLARAGTLRSLSFFVSTAMGDLRLGVYDATGPDEGPGKKIAETNPFTPQSGWNTVSVRTAVSLDAGTYWLVYLPSSDDLSFRVTSSGRSRWYSFPYGPMPPSFQTAPNAGSTHWSFYATLEAR